MAFGIPKNSTSTTNFPYNTSAKPEILDTGKILVATGLLDGRPTNDVEIIDVERNVSCRMKKYPEFISGGTGGLIIFNGSLTPVLCGGLHSKWFTTDRTRCYVWKGQEWVEGGDTYRGGHLKTGGPPTSVVLDEQFLWLVGGFGHPSNPDPNWL